MSTRVRWKPRRFISWNASRTGSQPLVTAEHARMVMQVYQAADLSAEEGRPVEIAAEEPAADRQAGTIGRAMPERAPAIS